MANIRDVAKEAGVSTATVSRAFTTPGLINLQTKQRVLAAARSLDYCPPGLKNSALLPSVQRTSRSTRLMDAIGFQYFSATKSVHDTLAGNGFYMSVLLGAQAEAFSLGLNVMIHTTDRMAVPLEIPRMVHEQAVGGLLLVGALDPNVLCALASHVPNIVLVDNHDEAARHESVISDGFGGSLALTRLLLRMGHKRVGFFMQERGVMTFQDRLRGYRCAMLEAHLCPTPDLVFGVGATLFHEQRAELIEFLRSPFRPSAVVCANDDAALFLMRLCRELDINVPADLSITGFDDIPAASEAEPSLTTARVDTDLIGRLAVRRLQSRFKNASGHWSEHPPVRHMLPVSLIVRNSCCPPS